jgi:hypothetical protein
MRAVVRHLFAAAAPLLNPRGIQHCFELYGARMGICPAAWDFYRLCFFSATL